jgi:hypothetical protein
MHGFGRFLGTRGYEFRMDRFALFQNIFAPGADEHLDLAAGQALFDDFFRFACDDMERLRAQPTPWPNWPRAAASSP